jgi:hypothetical protein
LHGIQQAARLVPLALAEQDLGFEQLKPRRPGRRARIAKCGDPFFGAGERNLKLALATRLVGRVVENFRRLAAKVAATGDQEDYG